MGGGGLTARIARAQFAHHFAKRMSAAEVENQPDVQEEEVVEHEENVVADERFKLVNLKEVEVDSGETEEECVYKHRAKLYRFCKDMNEWKERGLGDAKLLQHKQTKIVRFVMRQEKTLKVVANHLVNPTAELKANSGSDTSWVWVAQDYAEEEPTIETFAIRFKTPEIAEEFKTKYDEFRVSNKKTLESRTEKDETEGTAKTEETPAPKEEESTTTA
jgi:Ran-binding protein 1